MSVRKLLSNKGIKCPLCTGYFCRVLTVQHDDQQPHRKLTVLPDFIFQKGPVLCWTKSRKHNGRLGYQLAQKKKTPTVSRTAMEINRTAAQATGLAWKIASVNSYDPNGCCHQPTFVDFPMDQAIVMVSTITMSNDQVDTCWRSMSGPLFRGPRPC